MIFSNNFK